jgi:hypothetical protein
MADILSSASLLLAVLTAIFSLFYPDIVKILDIVPKTGSLKKDNGPDYVLGIAVRNSKVLPLFIGGPILTLVFIPVFLNQLKNVYLVFKTEGFKMSDYDTANASYIVVTLFAIALTTYILILSGKFFSQLKKLRP